MISLAAAGLILVVASLGLRRAGLRRRRALREALHELRRPLGALALERPSHPGESALLEQVCVAIADLEAVVDGRAAATARDRFTVGRLLREAAERWPGAPVAVADTSAPACEIEGDRVRLGMALDNLIANGLEHGSGDVRVAAAGTERTVRLEVVNGGAGGAARSARATAPDRGHGLRIAARHVAADDGRVEGPHLEDGEIVAAVELPRRPDPGPRAA